MSAPRTRAAGGVQGRGRPLLLLAVITLTAGACGSDTDRGDGAPDRDREVTEAQGADAEPFEVDQVAADPPSVEASALDDPRDASFPPPLIELDRLLAGGPPPDGIPSIDDPTFLRVDDVAFVEDGEAVLVLEIDGDARAYPVQIMTWHEIVNDTVGGTPVTVSFCPLCNSAIAYDRRLDGRTLDFGTSGMLYNSALVMYDRQTETLWSHFTAEAIVGTLTGSTLETIPMATVSWADFKDAHPDGLVLSRETGHLRDYGRNPYPGYDEPGEAPFLFDGEVDGRLAAKERVIGIRDDGQGVAVRTAELAEEGVVEVKIGPRDLVVWLQPGTASALDDATVSGGRDVGATGVFDPVVDGQRLTFTRTADGFVDEETASRWDVLGRAVEGPLRGATLKAYPHVDTFWFAWAAFLPDTEIVPPLDGRPGARSTTTRPLMGHHRHSGNMLGLERDELATAAQDRLPAPRRGTGGGVVCP